MRRVCGVIGTVVLFLTVSVPGWADETYRLRVDGLACPFCAYGIEKKLKNTDGVESVDIRLNDGLVLVTVAVGATLDEAHARQIVTEAGFTLRGFEQIANAQ